MRRLLSWLSPSRLPSLAGPALPRTRRSSSTRPRARSSSSSIPDAAPKTVENFLDYVKAGHYDGTQFHRVIDGFMIQGGGFTTRLQGKSRPSRRSRSSRSSATRPACRTCRARSRWRAPATRIPRRRSSSSTSATTSALDFRSADAQGYGYTVFGKVVDGMDVVDKIAKGRPAPAARFPTDVPVEPSSSSGATSSRSSRMEDPHGRPAHEPRRHHARARRARTRPRRSRTSCSTCATATTTTRCSIA